MEAPLKHREITGIKNPTNLLAPRLSGIVCSSWREHPERPQTIESWALLTYAAGKNRDDRRGLSQTLIDGFQAATMRPVRAVDLQNLNERALVMMKARLPWF